MTLNAQLLAAHARGDTRALVGLYVQAADDTADIDAACFYLTHAYVYALETAHPDTSAILSRLRAHGRA